MKKILFVYTQMVIGGSTTSLISVLNNIDYSKYEVDLLLYENKGDLFDKIHEKVNVLSQANLQTDKKSKIGKRLFSVRYIYKYFKAVILSKKNNNSIIKSQILNCEYARLSRRSNKQYDVAISFVEGWPCDYVGKYIMAKKKITWFHSDYKESGFLSEIDKDIFNTYDNIVLVSELCANSFIEIFPMYKDKVRVIENILVDETIKYLSELEDYEVNTSISIATICRISFTSKGLDRGVKAFNRLKNEGILDDLHWYIIGDGADRKALEKMIFEYGLNDNISMLGQKLNPFPYIKDIDIFFLPSRYEGKPMVVTEAKMLGLVPLVTKYTSANEQVNNGINGLIVENNDEAIYEGLKQIITNRGIIDRLKKNLDKEDYSNIGEMEKINNLIDG